MTRSEASTFLEDANRDERLLPHGGVREQRRSCPVCGARIGSGDPSVQIRDVAVHLRCAVYRRRLGRR